MCLTSVPTEFQEIDDFNFDDYDSEYLDDKDELGKIFSVRSSTFIC